MSRATAPTIPAANVTLARDEVLAKGVTINGLVILSDSPLPWNPEHTNPPGGLDAYYRNNVIGGAGAFRHGGGESQFVRPGDREEDDRRDRVQCAAAAVVIR